ncbi:uncharacterized protein LOC113305942 [Papaver somniferum]|uniref:uncharacterized protein LOC113305942 n=1 Tax=Papaver somniferum TaxID=3469 RepID=UPI000E702CE1|nr:uncharacterized protein LOC113305942 [Papaver somniferum]
MANKADVEELTRKIDELTRALADSNKKMDELTKSQSDSSVKYDAVLRSVAEIKEAQVKSTTEFVSVINAAFESQMDRYIEDSGGRNLNRDNQFGNNNGILGPQPNKNQINPELKALVLAKNPHLTEDYFTSSFINGLKEDLRLHVQMFSPKTLTNAIYLARMQEALLDNTTKKTRSQYIPSPLYVSNNYSQRNTTSPVTSPRTFTKSFSPSPASSSPPIKKLSYADMRKRREKGLCYNCDEVFQAGHKCIKQQIYMLAVDEEESTQYGEDSPIETPNSPIQEEEVEISVHALAGNVSHNTIHIEGATKKHPLTILLDSGSTHSFLDPATTTRCGGHVITTSSLLVVVDNGNKLVSDAKCPSFKWQMQGHDFQFDMQLLTLGGCDMVLGVDWMRGMSPMIFDFNKSTAEFSKNGQNIKLQGNIPTAQLSMMSDKALHKWLKKNKSGMVGRIFAVTACDEQSLTPAPILPLLEKYASVFQEPITLPPSWAHDHHIPLKPLTTPLNQRPYRIPYIQKEVMEQLVQQMLKSEELLDELFGARVFTKIDLRAGYHQIRVFPPDTYKTAFRTHQGHYEFMVMPFGLTNAPASFQALMNDVFQPHLRKFILVFFDDILVYNPDMEAHLEHLEITLKTLQQRTLHAKLIKCTFGQSKVEYLEHIITGEGVKADPTKVECMLKWPIPTTLKELRGFLGLTGYYRKFVQGYGIVCKPLTELLKKDNFHWNTKAQAAFEALKKDVTTTPVLALHDFNLPFEVETDACDTGVGAVLMQNRRPLAYFSKGMGTRFIAMSTYEKELLAIVIDVSKWRPYLMGNHFTIFTDHQRLKFFTEQRLHTVVQQK